MKITVTVRVPPELRTLARGLGQDFAAAFRATSAEAGSTARFTNRTGQTRGSLRDRTEARGADWLHGLSVGTVAGSVFEHGAKAQVVGVRGRAVKRPAIAKRLFLRRILRRRAAGLRRRLRARLQALGGGA